MKKIISVFIISLSLAVFLNAGTATAMGKKHERYPDVKTVSKEELLTKIQSGAPVQVVNVLGPGAYKLGFIKGSLKIPYNEIEKRSGELDKSKEVVTYCANYHCAASRIAAHKLGQQGFNVRAYEGGIQEWKEAGLPTE